MTSGGPIVSRVTTLRRGAAAVVLAVLALLLAG
jgi:hypothetical protein